MISVYISNVDGEAIHVGLGSLRNLEGFLFHE